MRRVLGFLLIVRALSPFLILLVLAVAGMIILRDLRVEMDEPIRIIQTEVDSLSGVVEDARDDLNTVQREISELVTALEAFNPANLIPDLSGTISIPSLTIPDVTVPIPDIPNGVSISTSSISIAGVGLTYPTGISVSTRNYTLAIPDISSFNITIPGLDLLSSAIESALAPITDIFNVFEPAFASINALNETLQQVPDSMDAITTQGEALLNGVRDVFLRWGQTLTIVLVVLAVLVVIYFGVPFLDDFTRGLRMLRGLPVD